jgi:hypothetical protein
MGESIRKLEASGFVQRVKAPDATDKLHPCVKIVKEPNDSQWNLFFHGVRANRASRAPTEAFGEFGADVSDVADGGRRLEAAEAVDPEPLGAAATDDMALPGRSLIEPPQWDPGRDLVNQIFDCVRRSGTRGITMQVSVRRPFFRQCH